jgi:hypothetical protein
MYHHPKHHPAFTCARIVHQRMSSWVVLSTIECKRNCHELRHELCPLKQWEHEKIAPLGQSCFPLWYRRKKGCIGMNDASSRTRGTLCLQEVSYTNLRHHVGISALSLLPSHDRLIFRIMKMFTSCFMKHKTYGWRMYLKLWGQIWLQPPLRPLISGMPPPWVLLPYLHYTKVLVVWA